jgi:hypothetical protein
MYSDILKLVNEQTEDEFLWNWENPSPQEQYLQSALRSLHELIEAQAGITVYHHVRPSVEKLH